MTFKVEDGSGVKGATSNVTTAQITSYLTDRGRQTQNGWDVASMGIQQAAAIEATDYIEKTNKGNFSGSKLYTNLDSARASLSFSSLPVDSETVTIGTTVYTFTTTLSAAFDILIGISPLSAIVNLGRAIVASDDSPFNGVNYGTGTTRHPDVTPLLLEHQNSDPDILAVIALIAGIEGNEIVSTETLGGSNFWASSSLIGGSFTGRPQTLSFPRRDLLDEDFQTIVGMPMGLIESTAEYAVRSVDPTFTLDPDPDIDSTGTLTTVEEKVGPLEEKAIYVEGTYGVIRPIPYPAADRLLLPYLKSISGGSVVRG